MEMKDIISQIKWNSYASAECPTKNGRYLVIMPQFTYSDNISLDINVLTYCVPMDDWCYLWGASVEENKLPLYWAEIDVNDIVNNFKENEFKTSINNISNTINNIINVDADMHIKYMPKSLTVNNNFNINDVIEIWEKDKKLNKYARTYKYWRDQSMKFLSPLCSNPALYQFFIECYKSAKKGENGFFIERVCYSTNIMWRNEFKFQRLIMSWHTGEEDNIDKLLAEVERIEKDKEEFEREKIEENKKNCKKEIDEEFIEYLRENSKLPEGFKLHFDNLKNVDKIWENENNEFTYLLSNELQKELKELKFRFVYADYHGMMDAINESQIDKAERRKWRFWQGCLELAKEEKCNFSLWYVPKHFKVTDKNRSLLLTKQIWAIYWGGYRLISWDCKFNENGELIKPELAYKTSFEEKDLVKFLDE